MHMYQKNINACRLTKTSESIATKKLQLLNILRKKKVLMSINMATMIIKP